MNCQLHMLILDKRDSMSASSDDVYLAGLVFICRSVCYMLYFSVKTKENVKRKKCS